MDFYQIKISCFRVKKYLIHIPGFILIVPFTRDMCYVILLKSYVSSIVSSIVSIHVTKMWEKIVKVGRTSFILTTDSTKNIDFS